jgi:signal transduction histidine kinase/CHASE2 domain-containing sensor protein
MARSDLVSHSRLRSWRWELAAALLGFAIGAAYLLGIFAPIDRFITDRTFALHARAASGRLVLVEIDPKSLQQLSTWPWSRAYHAALIDKLLAAGAARVGFDVDFSASSAPDADAALARAVENSDGRVFLATFSHPDSGDAVTKPLPAFAGARSGLVNIFADPDSRLRRYRLNEDRVPGAPMTLAAALAMPVRSQPNAFAIDYTIAPASIPRLSYVDVLTGRFDPRLVAGRTVLVGANAIELGDRYPAPVHGYLAGVEIQALAYETLVLDRAIHPADGAWVILGLALLTAITLWWRYGSWRSLHWATAGGLGASLGIGVLTQTVFSTTVDTAPWLAAIAGGYLLTLLRDGRRHARTALQHRASATRERALMRGVFNDSFDGILIVDGTGRIALANPVAAQLLEADPESLLGRPAADVLPGLTFTGEGAPATDLAVQTEGGRALALSVAVTLSHAVSGLDRDGADVWIVTFRDESARRSLEQARALALRELEAASAAKNEFLARISHELRTPLSAIIGFSTIISDQSIGPIGNAKYVEYARDVVEGGKRLLELVNDVIDVVRIEAGQFEVRNDIFEARSLLIGCIAQVRAFESIGERDVRVEILAGAEAIHGDRQALSRALTKLLENSVKFTGPKGEILLRAARGAERDIVIEVKDNGIGIAESALNNVVKAFSQVAGGLDRTHEGAGLGLHLAHRLMALLNGRLEIESTPGMGTSVRLVLHEAAAEASAAA